MDSPPTLLLLPVYVRIRIYRLCGLTRPCPIDLNFEGVRQRWISIARATTTRFIDTRECRCRSQQYRRSFDDSLPPGLECFCPPIPFQLLRVSHAIHDGVASILYRENQFKVSRQRNDLPDHHLMKLWALSPKVWGLMKSLHINLTEIG